MAKPKEGKLLASREVILNRTLLNEIKKKGAIKTELDEMRTLARRIRVYRIIYQSNGHRVNGFVCEPRRKKGKSPCIIWNRGGLGEFGTIKLGAVFRRLSKIADWGYIVISTQYSGNAGSEGTDDAGGPVTLKDVLNLKTVLSRWPSADTKRIGMHGGSRGGMMTYLCLARVRWIKAAVSVAGLANVARNIHKRPDLRATARLHGIRTAEDVRKRSAVRWPGRFSKKTPLLMMHGTADWRVTPQDSLDLAGLLLEQKVPYRLVMFEGDDHGLTEHLDERDQLTRVWFDRFVKNNSPLPNLKPHGK